MDFPIKKREKEMNKRRNFNNDNYCTLGEYASYYGVTVRTAYNHYYSGRLAGAFKDVGGTNRILVPITYIKQAQNPNVTIYATVSISEENNKDALEKEVMKLRRYCTAKGYRIQNIITEFSYGIFDERPKLISILKNRYIKHVVVANKSSVNRFSFDFISAIMSADGRELEYMTSKESDETVFKKDLTDTIYVVCKKLGTKDVSYEDVRKTMVALGIADRKSMGGRPKKKKRE